MKWHRRTNLIKHNFKIQLSIKYYRLFLLLTNNYVTRNRLVLVAIESDFLDEFKSKVLLMISLQNKWMRERERHKLQRSSSKLKCGRPEAIYIEKIKSNMHAYLFFCQCNIFFSLLKRNISFIMLCFVIDFSFFFSTHRYWN